MIRFFGTDFFTVIKHRNICIAELNCRGEYSKTKRTLEPKFFKLAETGSYIIVTYFLTLEGKVCLKSMWRRAQTGS